MPFLTTTFTVALTILQNVAAHQQPLQEAPQTQKSFIENSIFGRHQISTLSTTPKSIPPTYEYRAFDSEGTSPYGIQTFAHVPYKDCFSASQNSTFDIAIVGAPFDLGVSYRPGARFGPSAARMAARRISPDAGWSMDHGVNPFRNWATVVDCGDIFNTPFDKMYALKELEDGWKAINALSPKNTSKADALRILSIGGDHTITLPILRALHSTWGKVAVLHFDSHLDTWDPKQLGGGITKHSEINHGTMLHIAHEEGLLSNSSNMHLGSRCQMFDEHFDLDNDLRCGFSYIRARELDTFGVEKVVRKIVERVGDEFVYLSVDIDVLDPAFAPATGTIEPGGWTTRELLQIIEGLSKAGLKIIGSDIVEYSPIYDSVSETTGLAISEIAYEILQWMIRVPVSRRS